MKRSPVVEEVRLGSGRAGKLAGWPIFPGGAAWDERLARSFASDVEEPYVSVEIVEGETEGSEIVWAVPE
jgi:hypothetical protein